MSEVIEEAVIVTEEVVGNNDADNVVDPAIAAAPEVTSPTAGPGASVASATVVIDTKTTRTRDEGTIKRQIHTNAVKHLTEQANKRYEADKSKLYEPPSEELIRNECKKRWLEHLDRKKGPTDISMYF